MAGRRAVARPGCDARGIRRQTIHRHPAHMSVNLALLAHEAGLRVRTAAGLDDEAIRADSLCQGWTRAHVLSHLARNAESTVGSIIRPASQARPLSRAARA